MDWLEDELKHALERKEPAPDFEARVKAAAGRLSVPSRRPAFTMRLLPLLTMPRWLAAAAALVLITGGGAGYRYHQGRVAKQQVMLAMRVRP